MRYLKGAYGDATEEIFDFTIAETTRCDILSCCSCNIETAIGVDIGHEHSFLPIIKVVLHNAKAIYPYITATQLRLDITDSTSQTVCIIGQCRG